MPPRKSNREALMPTSFTLNALRPGFREAGAALENNHIISLGGFLRIYDFVPEINRLHFEQSKFRETGQYPRDCLQSAKGRGWNWR